MIHFHEVHKQFDAEPLFTDLTLFLPKASYTLISGEKHSGRTTLLRMIMAYEKPDRGALVVDGIDLINMPTARVPYLRRQIGFIADIPVLLEAKTVAENLSVPLQLGGFDPSVIDERIEAALEKTGLIDVKNRPVSKLNPGLQQRLSAARATIHKPPVVLADEPFLDADSSTTEVLVDLLEDARAYGATILVTGPDSTLLPDYAPATANMVRLVKGRVEDEFKQPPLETP